MRIRVRQENLRLSIPFPNCLLFSSTVTRLVLRTAAPDLPPELSPKDIARLVKEMGRIRRKLGPWELVHVETGDGDTQVSIQI